MDFIKTTSKHEGSVEFVLTANSININKTGADQEIGRLYYKIYAVNIKLLPINTWFSLQAT